MAERILGETGGKRRRRLRYVFLPVLLGALIALFKAGSALAVHDQTLQLDGEDEAELDPERHGDGQRRDGQPGCQRHGCVQPLRQRPVLRRGVVLGDRRGRRRESD